jgi:hypothetical protein
MKYAAEMGSDTKCHKDWFRYLKDDRGDTQTHRQQGDPISLLSYSFFQNKKSGLKIVKVHQFGQVSFT